MESPALTDDQRLCLGLIYEHFHVHGQWPRVRDVQRRLANEGRSVDVKGAIESLPPGSGTHWGSDGVASLTARGLYRLRPDAEELSDLLSVVQLGVRRFRGTDAEPVLARSDLTASGMDAGRARRCYVLLQSEGFVLGGGGETPDGEWTRQVSDDIWRFEGVDSVPAYFQRDEELRAGLGKRAISPTSFPAAADEFVVPDSSAAPGQELFEALQTLRDHRDAGQRLQSSPFKHGDENLWINKASALIHRVLGDDDKYITNSFDQASAPRFTVETEDDFIGNRNRMIEAKLPSVDEALEAGNRRLARLAAPVSQQAAIAVPPTSLPSLNFDQIGDAQLQAMARRDYRELRFAVYQQLTKAQTTLAGSVAEIALFDALLRTGIDVADIEQESMGGLYKKAVRGGVLAGRSQKAIDAVRDTRNFVHAGVERRNGALTQADANAALAIMFLVLKELGIQ